MKSYHPLFLAFLTIPLTTTAIFAEPIPQSLCSSNFCETHLLAQRGGGGRQGGERGPDKFMEQLNLSQAQVQQLKAIRQKYSGQMEPLEEQIRLKAQELSQLMEGTASNDVIRTKHQEMLTLRQKMGTLRFESMLEMRDILTPEQRREFGQLMQQRRHRMGGNRGEGGDISP
jgi:Spy/CpxP family protein refolding chaperone